MNNQEFDLVVIGAGTGGYVAAIKAAQAGLNVACIDKWINKNEEPALGGTCLNVGCIPSKALLETTHKYSAAKEKYQDEGIEFKSITCNIKATQTRKNKIVSELTSGIAMLFQANKVTWLQGIAQIIDINKISFRAHKSKKQQIIDCKNIIIATGSEPTQLKDVEFDHKLICDSEDALDWSSTPKRLGVIGAGAIGLEVSSIWARLGSKVTIIKNRLGLLPDSDPDIARTATKVFERQGMNLLSGIQIDKIKTTSKEVTLTYTKEGKQHSIKFDKLLVAIGRKPYTKGILADNLPIKIDEKGFIKVNDYCQTAVQNIYAIGDCVRGPMLAHKSSEEAAMVIEKITTGYGHLNYDAIPFIIYTSPEIAWVGLTEKQAKQQGYNIKSGKFPFSAIGRAKAAAETDGLVKIISCNDTDKILGIHIIGHNASELIGQGTLSLEFDAVTEDLQRITFAHPTLSEAIHEAALDTDAKAIHMVSRKK